MLPVEMTKVIDEQNVEVLRGVEKGQYIRQPGTDVKEGETILVKGTTLRAGEIGTFALRPPFVNLSTKKAFSLF